MYIILLDNYNHVIKNHNLLKYKKNNKNKKTEKKIISLISFLSITPEQKMLECTKYNKTVIKKNILINKKTNCVKR